MKSTISYKGIIMEIKKAAIRIGNKIFTGFDHGECFNQIPQELRNQSVEQGFVTDSNEFVDRKEAMIIARQANQIAYDDGEKKTLISEDLHLNWLNKMNKELTELKQKASVPKYQVGQALFRIDFSAIVPFVVNEIYVHIKVDKTISIQYFDYVGLVIEENELFATREEAKQQLAKIGE